MEKLVLIDGNSLINRAFYAMPILSSKDGKFTNAVYGFMNMFTRMVTDIKPKYVAVAFDLKAPTFRHKMYAEYKGTRKPMPEELRPQIPLLKEVLSTMGVKILQKEGSEADDIIGTVAKATDVTTYIFTGDRDSFQLVDDKIEVHFTRRGITDVDILTHLNFKEKTGITPSQVIDLKALMGDSSDNIPGVPGVGEKTALNLIQTYGTVENLYNNVDDLKGKLKEKIVNGKDLCFLSKQLATIDVNVDVDTNLDSMILSFPFGKAVKEKFVELDFKSLYQKESLFLEQSEEFSTTPQQNQDQLKPIKIVSVDNLDLLKTLDFNKTYSLAVEQDLVCLFDGQVEYKLAVNRTLLDDGFNLGDIITALAPLFSSNAKIITYGKKDLKRLVYSVTGEVINSNFEDLSLVKYLVDFTGGEEKLSVVLDQYGLDKNTPACSVFNLFNKLSLSFDQKTESLYKNVELPLSDVLLDMEIAGFKVDAIALAKTGEGFKAKLEEYKDQIRRLTNEPELNVNSPKQLGEVLFEKLKIAKGKKTKTGYSTSAEVLEDLEDAHPVVGMILEFRKIQKLYSTYVEGFKPLIEKSTGLIHTCFNQTVTATGRLSSKEPNLQNIPVREELGRELRRFFVPRNQDGVLVSADYSQIELRLLAEFSKTKSLIDAFKKGEDVHRQTASKVFGVGEDQVTPQMRSRAKAVNFGIIYGISEYGLAKQLKISPAEARGYINSYFKEFPQVKEYMNQNVAFAKLNGYSVTVLGRKRQIPELNSSNYSIRQFGERVAMNMPLQGSSADIIKLAMLGVSKKLKELNLKSKLILQVHDELIVDCVKDEIDLVEKILVEQMEGALNLEVPLTVSVGKGESWFDAK
ncbi:MAG: DNA polymerase I [Clostridia bacterium]|nr:DNA polymerase I [Clostridia bacterium]